MHFYWNVLTGYARLDAWRNDRGEQLHGWTGGHVNFLVAVTSLANPTHALRLNLISLASEKSKLASPARTRFAA